MMLSQVRQHRGDTDVAQGRRRRVIEVGARHGQTRATAYASHEDEAKEADELLPHPQSRAAVGALLEHIADEIVADAEGVAVRQQPQSQSRTGHSHPS